jgi:hypothetical protein
MDLSDDDLMRFAEADRREVDPRYRSMWLPGWDVAADKTPSK